MAPSMPCKIMKNCGSGGPDKHKTKLACILEANESTRMRMGHSEPSNHEDHIAGKGENSLQHYNLVHKFIPMPQAMKIPAAKAAVDKEWEKLEKISAWNLTKVKSKKQVIDEARTSGATVHFASLMDICHLKNAELEAKHQKYKGRVVPECGEFRYDADRGQPDFKKALSTLYRLKKAEDKKHHENWSQSSSSMWQWQTTWWHPYYENSPQRWSEH